MPHQQAAIFHAIQTSGRGNGQCSLQPDTKFPCAVCIPPTPQPTSQPELNACCC